MTRVVLAFDYHRDDELREVVRDGTAYYEVKRRPGRSDAYAASSEKIPADRIADRIRMTGLTLSKYRRDRCGITAEGVAWLRQHAPRDDRPDIATPLPDPDAILARDTKRRGAQAAFLPWLNEKQQPKQTSPCGCAALPASFAVVTPAACKGRSEDAISDLARDAADRNDGGTVATPGEQPPLEVKRGGKTFVYYDDSEGDFWPEQAIKEGFTVLPVEYGLGRKGSRVTVYYVSHTSAAKMKAVRAHLKKHLPRFF